MTSPLLSAPVRPLGPCPPVIELTGADSAGDVIHYTISVQNTGNVALTGLLLTDPNADVGSILPVTSGGYNTGDSDHDNIFDAGETWNFTATHTVTQGELDNGG